MSTIAENLADIRSRMEAACLRSGRDPGGVRLVGVTKTVPVERIREGMKNALKSDLHKCRVALPGHFDIEVQFKDHSKAHLYSFYPGAALKDPVTVRFAHADYYEALRFLFFAG